MSEILIKMADDLEVKEGVSSFTCMSSIYSRRQLLTNAAIAAPIPCASVPPLFRAASEQFERAAAVGLKKRL